MKFDPVVEAWLKHAAKESGDRIKSSNVFLSLVTPNYEADPLAALQLGIAVLLDKPIILVVEKGTQISDNLRRLAKDAEYFDPKNKGSLEEAVKSLLTREVDHDAL